LLQYASNISTARVDGFLEFILKPITVNSCKHGQDEFCQDSRQYIVELLNWRDRQAKNLGTEKQRPCFTMWRQFSTSSKLLPREAFHFQRYDQ